MIKIIIDIIMFIAMIALMKIGFLGIEWHEIIGIAILGVTIVHILLNLKWIKSMFKNFKKTKTKSKFMFILDILLCVLIILDVILGICISKYLFSFDINVNGLGKIHKCVSTWLFIVIAIHVGLHLDYIINQVKKVFKFTKQNIVTKIAPKILYLIIAVFAIVSLFKTDFTDRLIPYNNNKNKQMKKELNDNNSEQKNFEDKNSNDNDSKTTIDSTEDQDELYEYLTKLRCNGCGKQCVLTNPRCRKGEAYQQQKIEEYNNNQTEDNQIIDNNNDTSIQKMSITSSKVELNSDSTSEDGVDEYLSKLHCNGCGKQCILTNPQCSKGETYRDEKIKEYNAKQTTNSQNSQEDSTKQGKSAGIFDYVVIMAFIIGGTHYVVKMPKGKKDRS